MIKIVFISPRPFGLMGTPGTYLLTDSYSKFADVHIISNINQKKLKIVYRPKNKKKIHKLNFGSINFLIKIRKLINEISPNIIILGNYAKWFEIVRALKLENQQAKFVLDIKSPLIIDNKDAFHETQIKGSKNCPLIDLVMTRCKEDVESWIPSCPVQVFEYPLGIKLNDYTPAIRCTERIKCRRFVYVGSINARRELDKLIHYFSKVPDLEKKQVVLDFYGDGPAVRDLSNLVNSLGLKKVIRFKGCLTSKALSARLAEYDAGIAWVPHGLYEYAPSLKLMEYLAAGLVPIAMDTAAHKKYAEKGFHVKFFNDSSESFADAVESVFHKGFSSSFRQSNLKQILQYEWDIIASEVILPELLKLKNLKKETMLQQTPKVVEKICSWDLPFEPEITPKISESKVFIAGILSDRLFLGLNPECELLLITPKNGESILTYSRPDIFLIESTWLTATGDWYMAQSIPGEDQELMIRLIRSARRKGIPTVFWMTMDSMYHQHFNAIAAEFDIVFCADPNAVDLLAKEGIRAEVLLPAVQPVMFNPIFNLDQNKPFDTGIIYDGWVDLFRYPELGKILRKFSQANLNIFQTNLMMYQGQIKRTDPELTPFIKGTVADLLVPLVLKNADIHISFDKGHRNKTEKTWALLQASGSRIPTAHLGQFENDQLTGIVRQFEDERDFVDYVFKALEGGINIEREKHISWRKTFSEHLFEKRVRSICTKAGVTINTTEYPMASLVTGTMRPELLDKCFRQFEEQTYPSKELILIFNGDLKAVQPYQEQYKGDPNVTITSIPFDFTIGTVLNYGLFQAKGDYFFRIDDDDTYGPNYIIDSLLYQKAVKADIFGKRGSFFHFEGEKEIYLRNRLLPSIKSFPANQLHKNQQYVISGCSFAASIPALKKYRFPDNIQASVDTGLIDKIKESTPDLKCMLVDSMNLIVERAVDVSSHTWRIDAETVKKKSRIFSTQLQDVIF